MTDKNIKIIADKAVSVSWNVPMWGREEPRNFWDPSRQLLRAIRSYQKISNSKNPFQLLRKKWCVVAFRFWSIVTGADIPLNSNSLGGGLLIPHPNGIVIHPDVVMGVNCLIFQQVTITSGVRIGYHVDIGAGAKILGPLSIGNNVRIGANAVLTRSVSSGETVVGIPAVTFEEE